MASRASKLTMDKIKGAHGMTPKVLQAAGALLSATVVRGLRSGPAFFVSN